MSVRLFGSHFLYLRISRRGCISKDTKIFAINGKLPRYRIAGGSGCGGGAGRRRLSADNFRIRRILSIFVFGKSQTLK